MLNNKSQAGTEAQKSTKDDVTTSSPNFAKPNVVRSAYYTPTIDEFHNGFEYEIFEDWDVQPEKNWHKQIFGKDGDNPEHIGYVYQNNLDRVRVKHIDKEDCLSLGLELKIWDNGSGYFKKWNYTIGIYGIDLFCTVSQNDYGNNIMRFSGDLKNKSELKRILQQVWCVQS